MLANYVFSLVPFYIECNNIFMWTVELFCYAFSYAPIFKIKWKDRTILGKNSLHIFFLSLFLKNQKGP
jgi:hypothetical protein